MKRSIIVTRTHFLHLPVERQEKVRRMIADLREQHYQLMVELGFGSDNYALEDRDLSFRIDDSICDFCRAIDVILDDNLSAMARSMTHKQ